MRVKRRDVAPVLQDDGVTVTVLLAAKDDLAVTGRLDRCAARCSVVDAPVCANGIEDRVSPARIETRANAGEIDRCAHECLAYAQSVWCVVIRSTVLVDVTNGLEGTAIVDEFRSYDLAINNIFVVLEYFLKQKVVVVAPANVENEVNVPGKNAGEIHYQFVGEAGGDRALKK